MAFIEVEEVSFRYPGTGETQMPPALERVNLRIEAGEWVALVGPNGSGKSTLARHLNALLLPDQGRVSVAGLVTGEAKPETLWEIRRRVGMVFQNPDNQIVATTVAEDVAFGPENLGVPPAEIRSRVEAALRQVGLWEKRELPPHQLSGGQKQRLAIAGVLAMHPQCLVLDEPTAMLDPQGRAEVLATLTRLHAEEGLTIVLITHSMEEAILAQRVVVLAGGRVVREGTPAEIFAAPAELAALNLEAPPLALLAAELTAAGYPVPPGLFTPEALAAWLVDKVARSPHA